jgi:hypothetical protein
VGENRPRGMPRWGREASAHRALSSWRRVTPGPLRSARSKRYMNICYLTCGRRATRPQRLTLLAVLAGKSPDALPLRIDGIFVIEQASKNGWCDRDDSSDLQKSSVTCVCQYQRKHSGQNMRTRRAWYPKTWVQCLFPLRANMS